MCLILQHNPKRRLTTEQFLSIWEINPDGFGGVSAHGEIFKTLDLFDALRWYRTHDPIVTFYRMRTHGSINKENISPFETWDKNHVFHNGIILGFGTDADSDSKHFFDTLNTFELDILRECETTPTTAFLIFDPEAWEVTRIGSDWHKNKFGWFSNYYAYDHSLFR